MCDEAGVMATAGVYALSMRPCPVRHRGSGAESAESFRLFFLLLLFFVHHGLLSSIRPYTAWITSCLCRRLFGWISSPRLRHISLPLLLPRSVSTASRWCRQFCSTNNTRALPSQCRSTRGSL